MLISPAELGSLRKLAALGPDGFVRRDLYVLQNFHLFLALDFDEIDVVPDTLRPREQVDRIWQDLHEDYVHPSPQWNMTCGNHVLWQAKRLRLRQHSSGRWYRFETVVGFHTVDQALESSDFIFVAEGSARDRLSVTFKQIASRCETSPQIDRGTALLLPNLLVPAAGVQPSLPKGALRSLLTHVNSGGFEFAGLSPRQFEELVADLLHRMGLQVHLTRTTRDGGRDIVARGELIPGEPLSIAVEVKHKPVVGIEDVRNALHANRGFPALLVVTSGRFSAGVLQESRAADNAYRLLLKDGVALKQWITRWGASLSEP